MKMTATGLALCVALAACGDGVPFNGPTDGDTGGGTGDGGDTGANISRDGLPAGTASPTPNNDIRRSETPDDDGNGTASNFQYNAENDTFTIDGLAFDGNNVYTRGAQVSSLGPFAVYDAPAVTLDSQSGEPVNQLFHRAIYGVSDSGNTEFAVVRTGQYVGYGFGGFIYKRTGGVTLETTEGAQGTYTGKTAGIRDFEGRGGMQYSTGDIRVDVDFGDFNGDSASVGDGVKGRVFNRRIFDINGNDVTNSVVDNINAQNTASIAGLPEVQFKIGPGALDANGEILGTLDSSFVNDEGATVAYESGNYYAIMSGERGQEIVGIMVMETGAEEEGVTARDTSGFIVYRGPAPAAP